MKPNVHNNLIHQVKFCHSFMKPSQSRTFLVILDVGQIECVRRYLVYVRVSQLYFHRLVQHVFDHGRFQSSCAHTQYHCHHLTDLQQNIYIPMSHQAYCPFLRLRLALHSLLQLTRYFAFMLSALNLRFGHSLVSSFHLLCGLALFRLHSTDRAFEDCFDGEGNVTPATKSNHYFNSFIYEFSRKDDMQ